MKIKIVRNSYFYISCVIAIIGLFLIGFIVRLI